MINYISYMYKLNITSYEELNKDYIIHTDSSSYLLTQVDNSNWTMFVHVLTTTLNSRVFYSYKFIQNIAGEFITKIEDVNYTLIRIGSDYNSTIDLMDSLDFYKKANEYLSVNNFHYENKWIFLWNDKIRYLTEHGRKSNKNINIMYYFNYYVGVASSLVKYLNSINSTYKGSGKDSPTICHPRIIFPIKKIDFYNPSNFIIDIESRDVGEYIKSLYYNNLDYENELRYYLSISKLSSYTASYLYARILYPSTFFDFFECNQNDQVDLLKFDTKNYENFVKKTYELINSYVSIKKIGWLKI